MNVREWLRKWRTYRLLEWREEGNVLLSRASGVNTGLTRQKCSCPFSMYRWSEKLETLIFPATLDMIFGGGQREDTYSGLDAGTVVSWFKGILVYMSEGKCFVELYFYKFPWSDSGWSLCMVHIELQPNELQIKSDLQLPMEPLWYIGLFPCQQ